MKANKNIILSHAGKQHSYQVAKALHELGYLKKYYTSTYVTNKLLQRFFEKTNNQFWTRRFINGIDGKMVEANWRFELKAFINRQRDTMWLYKPLFSLNYLESYGAV